jgi:hypothetical protein
MRQLHPRNTALGVNEASYSSQRLNVIVLPNPKILRANAALGQNGGCFGENQPCSANCPAA